MAASPQAVRQLLGSTRQPRGMVKINGNAVPGWVNWQVAENAYREASTFSVTFALSKLPAAMNEAWFASQTTIGVEILAGFPVNPAEFGSSELDSLVVGNVDQVHYDPAGRTLELSGRDLTSLLIDAKTTEKFQNQTASEVATTLAQRHGLTPVVASTAGAVGRFYQIDHTITTCAHTEWDLLTELARYSQSVVYVKGRSLYFQPAPNPASAPKYPVKWTPASAQGPFSANVTRVSFSRTLTVGNTITVTVRSWNQKQRKGFSATYPTNHAKGIKVGSATSPAQLYSYAIANLTQEQATQRARAIYNELIRNEMRMKATLPADNVLDVTHVIPVTGTGTAFDQTYYPETITRHMGMDSGYVMDVTARNHSNDVEPAA